MHFQLIIRYFTSLFCLLILTLSKFVKKSPAPSFTPFPFKDFGLHPNNEADVSNAGMASIGTLVCFSVSASLLEKPVEETVVVLSPKTLDFVLGLFAANIVLNIAFFANKVGVTSDYGNSEYMF